MFRSKQSISLVLTESYRESSKDSNSHTKTFTLNEGNLLYDFIYRGFPDDKEEHKKLRSNGSMIDAIRAKIKTQSLFINYDKKFPVQPSGYRTSIGMQLTIHDGVEAYSISVSGNPPEVREDEIYRKLSVLYSFVSGFFQK